MEGLALQAFGNIKRSGARLLQTIDHHVAKTMPGQPSGAAQKNLPSEDQLGQYPLLNETPRC